MKHLMSGNEATARGVYEAGIKVCSAYPGTPSTEILENLPQYGKDVYCEWAPNEKVATEVAYGASVAGSRSFCTMKMVGLNVAADPLFTAGYMGVNGAYVVVTADDPSCHSSQNEQDNRHYARAAKIAMGVSCGLLGYDMYCGGNNFRPGDGILGTDVEDTIRHVGVLAAEGMRETDRVILRIMTE